MNLVKIALGVAMLVVLVMAASMLPQAQPSKAFASDIVAVGDDPVPIKCVRTCNTDSNGIKSCGTGGLRRGCVKVVNNNCIFELCPE